MNEEKTQNIVAIQRQLCNSVRWREKYRRRLLDNRLQRLEMHRSLNPFEKNTAPTCMDLDQNEGNYLLYGGANGSVALTNLASLELGRKNDLHMPIKLSHGHYVTDCQFYANDIQLFATCAQDGMVKLWDLPKITVLDKWHFREPPLQMHWHSHSIVGGNPLIAIANNTSQIRIIDTRVGIAQEIASRQPAITSIRWCPTRRHLLMAGTNNGKLLCFDVRSGRGALSELQSHQREAKVVCLRFTSDGQYLFSLGSDLLVKSYEADTLQERRQFYAVNPPPLHLHRGKRPYRMALCDEGTNIRLAIPYEEKVLWIRVPENSLEEPSISELHGHFVAVNDVLYRPKKQELLTSSGDQTIMIWGTEGAKIETEDANEKRLQAQVDSWSDED